MPPNQQIQNFITALEAADGVSVDAGITDGAVQITDDEGDTLHITSGGRMLVSVPGTVDVQQQLGETGDYGQATVTTTPTEILPANPDRQSVFIQNLGEAPVYVGFDDSVTASTGVRVGPSSTFSDETYAGAVYVVSQSGTNDARYQEVSV